MGAAALIPVMDSGLSLREPRNDGVGRRLAERVRPGQGANGWENALSGAVHRGSTRLHALLLAFRNSINGLRHALATERAVRQEAALLALGLPVAWLIASGLWVWVALVASLLGVLAVEFLNTAVEKLCDHVTPERHPQIAIVKDLGSAAALCAQALALLIWLAALWQRFAG